MNRHSALLLLSTTILLAVGVAMQYSSALDPVARARFEWHLVWLATGLVAGTVAACLPTRWLARRWVAGGLFGLAVALLVLTLVLGGEVNGARRWLLGGQPSEFAKIALVIALSAYGAAHLARMHERRVGFLQPGLALGVVVGLVFIEPDWGTALLLAGVGGALLCVSGTAWFYLGSTAIAVLEIFGILLCRDLIRLNRVLAFLQPEQYKDGVGWQGWQSVLSIASGGLWGRFFGEGLHKLGFVPEQQTDFIFSLIGEELGFWGTTLVVLAFVNLVLAGLSIGWRASDPFGQLLATGLTLLIGLQAFINIGVATSSLPNKGLPLPFVSYGGSSLVAMLVCIGLVVGVARQTRRAAESAAE